MGQGSGGAVEDEIHHPGDKVPAAAVYGFAFFIFFPTFFVLANILTLHVTFEMKGGVFAWCLR